VGYRLAVAKFDYTKKSMILLLIRTWGKASSEIWTGFGAVQQ
jgi:hypothetical protein